MDVRHLGHSKHWLTGVVSDRNQLHQPHGLFLWPQLTPVGGREELASRCSPPASGGVPQSSQQAWCHGTAHTHPCFGKTLPLFPTQKVESRSAFQDSLHKGDMMDFFLNFIQKNKVTGSESRSVPPIPVPGDPEGPWLTCFPSWPSLPTQKPHASSVGDNVICWHFPGDNKVKPSFRDLSLCI